jgi:hypothetical protein
MKKRKLNHLELKKITIAHYKDDLKGGIGIDTSCGDKNCACYTEENNCNGNNFEIQ